MRMQALCMRTRTWAFVCVHMLGFQKLRNASFSTLKLRFRVNLTLSGSHSKLPFSQYKKPYMVPFENTPKILRENLRFTKNSKSKREFFIKDPQVNIF